MRVRLDLETFGTRLTVSITVLVLASLVLFGAMKTAVADLHLQNLTVQGQAEPASRWLPGRWLSALVASDLAPDNVVAVDTRAGDLDHHADRLVEATAVLALVGMLVAVLSAPPGALTRARDEANTPLANTMSNGKV